MTRDDKAPPVQPQDEVARRVHRYESALLGVLRTRPEEERVTPITNEENLLARQIAEAVTAFERSLRKTPLPPAKVDEEPVKRVKRQPPKAATPKRRKKRAKRKPAAKEPATEA